MFQLTDILTACSFMLFANAIADGGVVKALCVPNGGSKISATRLKKGDVIGEALKSGVKGLPFLKVGESGAIDSCINSSALSIKLWELLCQTSEVSLASCSSCVHSGKLEGLSAITSSLSAEQIQTLLTRTNAQTGDLILFATGPLNAVNRTLDRLRNYLGGSLGLIDEVSIFCFV